MQCNVASYNAIKEEGTYSVILLFHIILFHSSPYSIAVLRDILNTSVNC